MNTIQHLLLKNKKHYTIFSIKNPHKKTRVIHVHLLCACLPMNKSFIIFF